MDCRRIESLLPPYVDGEAKADEITQVERHLATCPSCRSAVAAQRTVRIVLRSRAAQLAAQAPAALRTRVSARVRALEEPPLGWRGRFSAFAAAAAVLLLVIVALEFVAPRSNVLYAAQLAFDHVRCFVVESRASDAVDSAAVEREYSVRHGWSLRVPPSSEEAGVTLVAARRCPFWLGRHAHLLYRSGDREVSLYINRDERPTDQLHVLGHRERIWRAGDTSYTLVAAGMPEAEFARIAAYLERETRDTPLQLAQ